MYHDFMDRFWDKVTKTDDCWLWTAATDDSGYGRFALNRQNRQAHRVAYEWENGPVPEGLVIDHLCRVRNCVRPSHMEAVTLRENIERGQNRGHWTACRQGHAYDEANTYLTPNGDRMCRTCQRAAAARYRARRRHAPPLSLA